MLGGPTGAHSEEQTGREAHLDSARSRRLQISFTVITHLIREEKRRSSGLSQEFHVGSVT